MNSSSVINYPSGGAGADSSELLFYSNEIDLCALYGASIDKPVGTTSSVGTDVGKRIFVTDTSVASLPALRSFCAQCNPLIIEAGEAHKTIDSVLAIVEAALERRLQRNSIFVGIGGGVICDMTAFAASIFKRGARLELVPTTLLAMADAAVGGKTACNFGEYKNSIGTFYPASRIHFFPATLAHLPEAEFRSGLAEVFKTALLFDAPLFELMRDNAERILSRDTALLLPMIQSCVEAKARIVESDPTEKGERMLLNLGHTFAHALESVAGFGRVSHGEAVAWGISRALVFSAKIGLCSETYRNDIFAALHAYGWETAPIHPALYDSDKPHDAHSIARALGEVMRNDKKNASAKIRLILQRGLTQNVIQEVEESDVEQLFRLF